MLMCVVKRVEQQQVAALAAAPPPLVFATVHTTKRSMETLVVVLAVITIVAVFAGVFARVCGGRHLVADHDIEGWVERRCRSCIDGGVPPPAPPQVAKSADAAAGAAKK